MKKSTLNKAVKSAIRKDKILLVKEANYVIDFFCKGDRSKDRNERIHRIFKRHSHSEDILNLLELTEEEFYESVRSSYYDSHTVNRIEMFVLAVLLDNRVGIGVPIKAVYLARDRQCHVMSLKASQVGYDPRTSPYADKIFRAVVKLKKDYNLISIAENGYIWAKPDLREVSKKFGGNPNGIDIGY